MVCDCVCACVGWVQIQFLPIRTESGKWKGMIKSARGFKNAVAPFAWKLVLLAASAFVAAAALAPVLLLVLLPSPPPVAPVALPLAAAAEGRRLIHPPDLLRLPDFFDIIIVKIARFFHI